MPRRHGWQELMSGSPGTRFADYYQRSRRRRAGKFKANPRVVGGALLIGAAILATRSRALAQALDRCEIRLRASARVLRKSKR
jgi:hypothetical protein